MDASGYPTDVTRRANELYWGSDASVNQIAADLDLSKSALYGLVEPLPSGYSCPACGEETGYANRTARQRDRLTCIVCDWAGSEDERGAELHSAPAGAGTAGNGRPSRAVDGRSITLDRASPAVSRMLIGGALIGAAAGIALVAFARRER